MHVSRSNTFLALSISVLFANACAQSELAGGSDDGDPTLAGGTGAGGGGATGPGGTGAGGAGAPTIRLGMACADDSECDPGGACLLPNDRDPFLGGGPAGGYCTAPCTLDIDCPGLDGVCLDAESGEGRCFLGCEIGVPPYTSESDPLSPDKCHGRHDLRCQTVGEAPVCLPTCGADSECPADRRCDPRLAVCVEEPFAGDSLGAACDPQNDTCAGRCVLFLTGVSKCSSLCVLGGGIDEVTTECGGLSAGFCAFRPMGNGMGDYGFCTESCSQHADCQNPDFWCFPVSGATDTSGSGYCYGAAGCETTEDCLADEACVETPSGKKCLSTAFDQGERPVTPR